MAGLSGFSYYKEITISNTNVDADLANFPVYVPIINDADIGGECLATGYDIQFADATNDNVLTFERLAGFAVTSGQANGDFYVLVPTVAGATDTVIRCYYKKAGATDVSSPENTFDTANGWGAVWHLEENGNPYYDATANNNDSTAGTYPDQIDGKVAKGQDFDYASQEYISFPSTASLNLGTSDFTISFWIKPESARTGLIITKKYNTYPYYMITQYNTGRTQFFMRDNSLHEVDISSATGVITAGNWYHIFLTVDRDSATGFKAAINASFLADANPTAVLTLDNTNVCQISGSGTTANYDGIIDEVRVNKSFLGADWGKFEYYNSHDGHAAGNELGWGAETATGEGVVAYVQRVIMVM